MNWRTPTPLFAVHALEAGVTLLTKPHESLSMSTKAATPHRWFASWRLAGRVPQNDPADLGTAFGLDMSLDPDWGESHAPSAPAPQPRGWVRRLTARRSPAT